MKKILVIEDDCFVAEVYGRMLAAAGYKVAIARDGESGLKQVLDFRPDLVHHVAGAAGIAGLSPIAHLAGALEILLQELHDQPKKVTPSTLNTLACAVDDEPIALQTLVTALGRASLKAVSLDDPDFALRVLASNRFDLIAKPFPLIEVAVKALTYLANGKPDTVVTAPAPSAG
jgi:chemotaxis response regulator CheB